MDACYRCGGSRTVGEYDDRGELIVVKPCECVADLPDFSVPEEESDVA